MASPFATSIPETSTPSAVSRSRLSRPKSSSPTREMMAAGVPRRPIWSMKIAGAPDGNGPTRGWGSRNPSPLVVATISTRISPTVSTFFDMAQTLPSSRMEMHNCRTPFSRTSMPAAAAMRTATGSRMDQHLDVVPAH